MGVSGDSDGTAGPIMDPTFWVTIHHGFASVGLGLGLTRSI